MPISVLIDEIPLFEKTTTAILLYDNSGNDNERSPIIDTSYTFGSIELLTVAVWTCLWNKSLCTVQIAVMLRTHIPHSVRPAQLRITTESIQRYIKRGRTSTQQWLIDYILTYERLQVFVKIVQPGLSAVVNARLSEVLLRSALD